MFSTAWRQAEVRSSAWLVPSSSTGMPMVATKPARHPPSGVREIVGAREPRPADVAPRGLAAMHGEAHRTGRGHLDRGDADFAIALGEVGVAGRKQGAFDVDRQEQFGAARELLDVEVAAVLARRQGAQAVAGGRAGGGYRADRVGRQGEPAAAGDVRLAFGPGRDLLHRWRDA